MSEEISLHRAKEAQLVRLRRDNHTWGDWSIMTDGYQVWISQQAIGAERTDHIAVPKAIFDRLISAYVKPRKLVRKPATPPEG